MVRKKTGGAFAIALLVLCTAGTLMAETTAYIANGGADEVLRITTGNEAVTTTTIDSPHGITLTPDGEQVLVTQSDGDALVFVIASDFSGPAFTLPVGRAPRGVAVEPTGRYAYVANFEDNTVSQVNIAGRTVVDTIDVGDAPWGVAARYDEENETPVAYVTNFRDETVTVIAKDNQTKVINVGDGPVGVAVVPEGSRVYVANSDDDTVSIIDTQTDTVVDTLNVGNSPWGVAVGDNGQYVYVTNSFSDTVTVIRTSDNTIFRTFTVGDMPRGVSAPSNGTFAYVVNQGEGSISRIDTDDQSVREFAVGLIDDALSIGVFIGDTRPTAPSDLVAETHDETAIFLSWTDNSIDESGFKIERRSEDEDNYVQITTVAANTTTYEDYRVSSDTLYYYRLRAYKEASDSDYSASANDTTGSSTVSVWCFIDSMLR
ncbi:MAG: beta-propeller fold lactonase family protein [Desulfosarcina sp.]